MPLSPPRTCSIENCNGKVFARGWCQKHYSRWYVHGSVLFDGPQGFFAGHRYGVHHGYSSRQGRSPTYESWMCMRQRCGNPRNGQYHNYGGRGITICDRWRSFENFLADMGERPEGKTLDRRDNDGNYEPENCGWATPKEQRANQRQKSAV